VAGKLTEGKLNYDPGTTSDGKELGKDGKPLPLWPQAEHIKGSFVFERARMEIRGDTATTGGVALSNVKAVIPIWRSTIRCWKSTAMRPGQCRSSSSTWPTARCWNGSRTSPMKPRPAATPSWR
jgi:hypothetical protein